MLLSEGVFTDQLHDFGKFFFFLKDLLNLNLELHEIRIIFVEIVFKHSVVVGVRDVPVDRGEMLSLGKFLIKTPEDLHDSEGGRSDGIGEITTWGRHSSDNGDSSLSVGRTEAGDSSSSFVELSQLGSEIGRVTSIGRHLGQTTGDFSESLSPSGGRVSHHGDVESHISEVLGKSDTSIDGSFSGGDRHVGCVGDKASTLHDILFFSIHHNLKLGELREYLSHLVSSFSTTHIDDTLRVGELGESLRDTSFSASKSTGDSASSSLHRREEGVEDSLSGEERSLSSEFLNARSGESDGPEVAHGNVFLLAFEFDSDNGLGDSVVASGLYFHNFTVDIWRHHDSVLVEEIVLEAGADDVSSSDQIANLDS